MLLYIAGPISGIPNHNIPAFTDAEKRLIASGYVVQNPHFGVGGAPWAEYVKFDLHLMLESDGVALLPGWEESRGATLEVHVAQALGMPVHIVSEWIELGDR